MAAAGLRLPVPLARTVRCFLEHARILSALNHSRALMIANGGERPGPNVAASRSLRPNVGKDWECSVKSFKTREFLVGEVTLRARIDRSR